MGQKARQRAVMAPDKQIACPSPLATFHPKASGVARRISLVTEDLVTKLMNTLVAARNRHLAKPKAYQIDAVTRYLIFAAKKLDVSIRTQALVGQR